MRARKQAHAIGRAVNSVPTHTCMSVPNKPSLSLGFRRELKAEAGSALMSDRRRVMAMATTIGPACQSELRAACGHERKINVIALTEGRQGRQSSSPVRRQSCAVCKANNSTRYCNAGVHSMPGLRQCEQLRFVVGPRLFLVAEGYEEIASAIATASFTGFLSGFLR